MNSIKSFLLTIGVWIFALLFSLLLGFWILMAWLRDHGPWFTKPLFTWLAGPSLQAKK